MAPFLYDIIHNNNNKFSTGITDVDTDIEAIRLINGEGNVKSGRLELLYNGTWGTVCDRYWSYSDAKVACRSVEHNV